MGEALDLACGLAAPPQMLPLGAPLTSDLGWSGPLLYQVLAWWGVGVCRLIPLGFCGVPPLPGALWPHSSSLPIPLAPPVWCLGGISQADWVVSRKDAQQEVFTDNLCGRGLLLFLLQGSPGKLGAVAWELVLECSDG